LDKSSAKNPADEIGKRASLSIDLYFPRPEAISGWKHLNQSSSSPGEIFQTHLQSL
jgi:hypothetical protein